MADETACDESLRPEQIQREAFCAVFSFLKENMKEASVRFPQRLSRMPIAVFDRISVNSVILGE